MVSYGLNTVRIPVGYWFLESLVNTSEHFAQGGEQYLDRVVGWAKDAGLYVIITLHGAPGAQSTDASTGQYSRDPEFYNDYNYARAYRWLEWITTKVHTNASYSNVGMLELVNEPIRTWDTDEYPNATAEAQSMREVSLRFSIFFSFSWPLLIYVLDILSHRLVQDSRQGVVSQRWPGRAAVYHDDG
jgi:aryl-phospho-beta-D-glucosidase BglC (GH1 family)